MEIPGLKPEQFFGSFCALFYLLVTALLEYPIVCTCLLLLYIFLANTVSTFKLQKVRAMMVSLCAYQFLSCFCQHAVYPEGVTKKITLVILENHL